MPPPLCQLFLQLSLYMSVPILLPSIHLDDLLSQMYKLEYIPIRIYKTTLRESWHSTNLFFNISSNIVKFSRFFSISSILWLNL